MGCEQERRSPLAIHRRKAVLGILAVSDIGKAASPERKHLEPVDMGELGPDASQVLPNPPENPLNLGRRLLRERRGEVGTADAVLLQPRADPAQRPAGEI